MCRSWVGDVSEVGTRFSFQPFQAHDRHVRRRDLRGCARAFERKLKVAWLLHAAQSPGPGRPQVGMTTRAGVQRAVPPPGQAGASVARCYLLTIAAAYPSTTPGTLPPCSARGTVLRITARARAWVPACARSRKSRRSMEGPARRRKRRWQKEPAAVMKEATKHPERSAKER
ncbi:hypothetical protein C8Q79DRAFT_485015 [Trametes meyenii]|nr:hypothetical protein C8Q79DRAFT_485015 [Trametes meyenii]